MNNELVLFAGVGGSLLASKHLGHKIVCCVERNPYCQAVLKARQEDGSLEPFPIFSDVDEFDGRPWRGVVDTISAGFPCQGFSVAGKQKGADDSRNKWPATARIIEEVRPSRVILENVPGIRKYVRVVAGDLTDLGYDCKWGVVAAREAGARHLRKRWWCVAHPHSVRFRRRSQASTTR